MKKGWRVLFLTVLTVLTIAIALGINVGAAEDLETNRALASEKYNALLDLSREYFEKGDAGKEANKYVVNVYAKSINEMTDLMLKRDGAADLIHLFYEQGVTAGHLAFLYNSYTSDKRLTDADVEELLDLHLTLQLEIEDAESADAVSLMANGSFANGGIYARMHVAIYNKLLSALLKEGDSDAVKQKVAVAKEDIKLCTVVATNEEYEAIYNRTVGEIAIQRNKDKSLAELNKIFSILCPGLDPSSSDELLVAIEYINRETTVTAADMNARLEAFATALISAKKTGGKYVDGYADKLISLIDATVSVADGNGEIATLSPILENYALDIKRATAKDAIRKNILDRAYGSDKKMQTLEEAYNADGGIIDGCKTDDELLFEKNRASLRADLYGKLVDGKAAILGFGQLDDLVTKAEQKFDFYDYNVASKDRSVAGAADACQKELHNFIGELSAIITEAELTAYKNKHAAILGKELADITVADKGAIISAIEGAISLSSEAAKTVEADGTIDKLAEKYKEVAKQTVDLTLGEARKTYAYEIKDQITKLSASSSIEKLSDVVSGANTAIKKAELVDSVLDRADEIAASKDYADFSEENKSSINKIASSAAETIIASDGGKTATDTASDAIIALNRAEACARLDAALIKNLMMGDNEYDKEANENAKRIASAAKEKVNTLTDPEEIKNAADKAIFDVEKEPLKSKLKKEAENNKNLSVTLGFLTEDEKKAFTDRIDESLADCILAIDSATTSGEIDAAVASHNVKVAGVGADASAKNAENKKAYCDSAKEKLYEKYSECKNKLGELKFLTEEEKSTYLESLEGIYNEAVSRVDSQYSFSDVDELIKSEEKRLSDASDKAKEADRTAEESAKTSLGGEMQAKYDEMVGKIDALTYTSDLVKNELKIKAKNALDLFNSTVATALTPDEMAAAKSEMLASYATLEAEAAEHELLAARAKTTDDLGARADEVAKSIMDLSHLSADQKSELISLVNDKLANANAHVAVAEDVETVLSIRELALAAIDAIERDAIAKDDEAYVEELMPLITTLLIIGAVEAVIAVGIVMLKRRVVMSVLVPTALPVLALGRVGAQAIAIGLAVIDLALAVYIGYSIVVIFLALKKKNNEENSEEITYEELHDIEEMSLDFDAEPEIEEEPEVEEEPEPITDFMYEPIVMVDTVDEITVEEADEMMSDEEAKNFEQLEINFAPEFREVYHGTKKAEINVDTISACFEAGDKVTLNTLKAKGLIAKNAGSVKILARGRLDKPLTVVAQKFSVPAIKMIVLTGGSAIVAEPSPERANK